MKFRSDMTINRRREKTSRQKAVDSGYRSGFEKSMAMWLEKQYLSFEYETDRFQYTHPGTLHNYRPDFKLLKLTATTRARSVRKHVDYMYIECKGKWDLKDRQKMYLIREQYPTLDIRMVFQRDPHKTAIRKGSKTTYADICEGRGRSAGYFKWDTFKIPFCYGDIGTKNGRFSMMLPEAWLEELMDFRGKIECLRPDDLKG